ncbi:MAG: tetratricopeptide repeat protein [Spirochaetaceae bacterium]
MGIIVLIIILGVAVGAITVFLVKSLLVPQQVAGLAEQVRQKKFGQAVKTAKKIISRDPRDPDAHYLLGLAYLGDDKPDLALMEFKTVNQIGSFGDYAKEIPFRNNIAELYLKFNQPEEALKEYLLLIKRDPRNAYYYYTVGTLFEQRNRSDRAAAYFKKTIELDENYGAAYKRLGIHLYRAKQLKTAHEYLSKAVSANRDDAEAHYYLGRIQRDGKDFMSAIGSFEKASKSPEWKIKAIVERGVAYLNMGDQNRATAELERAITLASRDGSHEKELLYARYFLATVHEKNRRMEQAIEQWEKIYEKKKDFRDVAEKLSQYQDLRTDDRVKDFMTAGEEEYLGICRKITAAMGLTVRDARSVEGGAEVTAVEAQSKWRNARKLPKLLWFLRVTSVVDEGKARALHEEMKKQNIARGVIVTSSTFSRKASDYAESRPIDLYDKDKLQNLLQTIEM